MASEAADIEEERRAIARAQAGHVAALEPLLRAHAQPLFASVILPRIGDRAQAEDLLKDVLVTAIEKIGTFEWQGRSFFFWLRQIALRRMLDRHRARGRTDRFQQALAREVEQDAALDAADELLIAEEDRRRASGRIDAALSLLPERYARAIRLRLIHERSREQCAAELGVQTATFDVVLFRAVRAFRKAYGERE